MVVAAVAADFFEHFSSSLFLAICTHSIFAIFIFRCAFDVRRCDLCMLYVSMNDYYYYCFYNAVVYRLVVVVVVLHAAPAARCMQSALCGVRCV